jgi:hypothetical protein
MICARHLVTWVITSPRDSRTKLARGTTCPHMRPETHASCAVLITVARSLLRTHASCAVLIKSRVLFFRRTRHVQCSSYRAFSSSDARVMCSAHQIGRSLLRTHASSAVLITVARSLHKRAAVRSSSILPSTPRSSLWALLPFKCPNKHCESACNAGCSNSIAPGYFSVLTIFCEHCTL